jgi:hypothetical protein
MTRCSLLVWSVTAIGLTAQPFPIVVGDGVWIAKACLGWQAGNRRPRRKRAV